MPSSSSPESPRPPSQTPDEFRTARYLAELEFAEWVMTHRPGIDGERLHRIIMKTADQIGLSEEQVRTLIVEARLNTGGTPRERL